MSTTIQLDHDSFKSHQRTFPITLICDGIKTPENVGMIFRAAEAFGVEKIVLCGDSATLPNSKIRKTARSCEQVVVWEYVADILDCIAKFKASHYTFVALEITNNSQIISRFNFKENSPIALVLGSETHGISEEVLEQCPHSVAISMYGKNSSLNVATATSIALYEITNQLNNTSSINR